MRFRVWVTFRAASQAEAHSRTAGPRRVFCAARMFELSDREFEELWPGLERPPAQYRGPWDGFDVRPHDNTQIMHRLDNIHGSCRVCRGPRGIDSETSTWRYTGKRRK